MFRKGEKKEKKEGVPLSTPVMYELVSVYFVNELKSTLDAIHQLLSKL